MALAQLLLDRGELTAEYYFSLVLLELRAHLFVDLASHLERLEGVLGESGRKSQAIVDVDRLEELETLFESEVRPLRNGVGQDAWIVGLGQRHRYSAAAELFEQLTGDSAVASRQAFGMG